MNEDKAIFEDLKKYLEKRDIKAEVEFEFGKWCIVFNVSVLEYYYLVIDSEICIPVGKPIVSLADPEYREKFYEHIKKKFKIYDE